MKRTVIFLGLIFSIATSSASFAKDRGLYERFDGKAVKVFVAPVQDATAEKVVDAAILRTKLEEALKARRSTTFNLVPTEAESEIVISTQISEYLWTDHDPIDMLMGVGGAAMDAAVIEDYARLQADVTVTDTRKQKDLWKNRVMATVTKKPMSQAESIPFVAEDFAKTFIKNAFSKPKR